MNPKFTTYIQARHELFIGAPVTEIVPYTASTSWVCTDEGCAYMSNTFIRSHWNKDLNSVAGVYLCRDTRNQLSLEHISFFDCRCAGPCEGMLPFEVFDRMHFGILRSKVVRWVKLNGISPQEHAYNLHWTYDGEPFSLQLPHKFYPTIGPDRDNHYPVLVTWDGNPSIYNLGSIDILHQEHLMPKTLGMPWKWALARLGEGHTVRRVAWGVEVPDRRPDKQIDRTVSNNDERACDWIITGPDRYKPSASFMAAELEMRAGKWIRRAGWMGSRFLWQGAQDTDFIFDESGYRVLIPIADKQRKDWQVIEPTRAVMTRRPD